MVMIRKVFDFAEKKNREKNRMGKITFFIVEIVFFQERKAVFGRLRF
jgi:hypothetical protein